MAGEDAPLLPLEPVPPEDDLAVPPSRHQVPLVGCHREHAVHPGPLLVAPQKSGPLPFARLVHADGVVHGARGEAPTGEGADAPHRRPGPQLRCEAEGLPHAEGIERRPDRWSYLSFRTTTGDLQDPVPPLEARGKQQRLRTRAAQGLADLGIAQPHPAEPGVSGRLQEVAEQPLEDLDRVGVLQGRRRVVEQGRRRGHCRRRVLVCRRGRLALERHGHGGRQVLILPVRVDHAAAAPRERLPLAPAHRARCFA
mmetsp:Transcript_33350/g.99312  ORF Transcript_33350/g.99312 Transcript_33350/m.99312 type:complete len:254 (+) Transcript_33350:1401-2162(+)